MQVDQRNVRETQNNTPILQAIPTNGNKKIIQRLGIEKIQHTWTEQISFPVGAMFIRPAFRITENQLDMTPTAEDARTKPRQINMAPRWK